MQSVLTKAPFGDKTWDYLQITKVTEARIRRLLADVEHATEPGHQLLLRQWAYGAYALWDELTLGWRENGDGERMERLAAGEFEITEKINAAKIDLAPLTESPHPQQPVHAWLNQLPGWDGAERLPHLIASANPVSTCADQAAPQAIPSAVPLPFPSS